MASVLQPFSGDVFEKPIKERTPALFSLSLDEEEEEDQSREWSFDLVF